MTGRLQFGWRETPSREQMVAIARQIDTDGYCRIERFVDPEELKSLASFAEDAMLQTGGEYASFGDTHDFAGTVWKEMASSPALRLLCATLYHHLTGRKPVDTGFYQIFRCLQGLSSKRHAHYFHFDSYAVTILVPIVIPAVGKSGDLVTFPAKRPIRNTYWRNVLDKLIVEFKPMQFYYRLLTRLPRSPATSIRLTPGSAILFWGYCTLHANEPCDIDKLRATGLLHFGNVHGGAKPLVR